MAGSSGDFVAAANGFDRAIELAPRGAGRYTASIHDAWTIGGRPNGGYLLAMLAASASDALSEGGGRHADPVATSAHYLAAPTAGTAEIVAEVLRHGRSSSQVRACLVQDRRHCVEALLTMGSLRRDGGPRWEAEPPVDLPPERGCVRLGPDSPTTPVRVSIMEVAEERLDPATLGPAAEAGERREAEVRGWFRFADGREPDPLSLLFVLDSFPPATLPLGSVGWVPTLELTAYVRAPPAAGPLRVRQRARLVRGGLVDETCDVWDSAGALVGQAAQLAMVKMPGSRRATR